MCPAGIALSGILALAIHLAALYGLYAIAPAAAPPAESDAAAGGLRAVLGRAAALLLFLPRVLFWHPNWRVAGLWAVGIGEHCRRHPPPPPALPAWLALRAPALSPG